MVVRRGPEGARALLSAITGWMISFTGLVFSITIVVLQLTSSQFSPRVLRTFVRDWFNQLALGVFVATFVYALVVLRAVRGTSELDPFVPQIAMTVAFGFVLASVGVFLGYIHHIASNAAGSGGRWARPRRSRMTGSVSRTFAEGRYAPHRPLRTADGQPGRAQLDRPHRQLAGERFRATTRGGTRSDGRVELAPRLNATSCTAGLHDNPHPAKIGGESWPCSRVVGGRQGRRRSWRVAALRFRLAQRDEQGWDVSGFLSVASVLARGAGPSAEVT